jgi:hypothetical protein
MRFHSAPFVDKINNICAKIYLTVITDIFYMSVRIIVKKSKLDVK